MDDIKNIVECLLFVSEKPLSVREMARIINPGKEKDIKNALSELIKDYEGRGIHIMEVAGGYQMCTKPQYSSYIEEMIKPPEQTLSHAALETIAIIAYKQPITKMEIEDIRGVNVDSVIDTLLGRKLIRQVGRRKSPGRPILYATSEDFLNYFGLKHITDLPEIE